uniref:Uncharacterized protein n=1 Tax=Glossina austeni TaxID=7395 RepID=A0A1A9VBJ6_GLOAU
MPDYCLGSVEPALSRNCITCESVFRRENDHRRPHGDSLTETKSVTADGHKSVNDGQYLGQPNLMISISEFVKMFLTQKRKFKPQSYYFLYLNMFFLISKGLVYITGVLYFKCLSIIILLWLKQYPGMNDESMHSLVNGLWDSFSELVLKVEWANTAKRKPSKDILMEDT